MCAEKEFSAPETAGCLQIHHNIKASAKKWGFCFHNNEDEKALNINMVLKICCRLLLSHDQWITS
jgi:hypothetical protein